MDIKRIDGGGWVLVRRVKRGLKWHQATDELFGTEQYGSNQDSTADNIFSDVFNKKWEFFFCVKLY